MTATLRNRRRPSSSSLANTPPNPGNGPARGRTPARCVTDRLNQPLLGSDPEQTAPTVVVVRLGNAKLHQVPGVEVLAAFGHPLECSGGAVTPPVVGVVPGDF